MTGHYRVIQLAEGSDGEMNTKLSWLKRLMRVCGSNRNSRKASETRTCYVINNNVNIFLQAMIEIVAAAGGQSQNPTWNLGGTLEMHFSAATSFC